MALNDSKGRWLTTPSFAAGIRLLPAKGWRSRATEVARTAWDAVESLWVAGLALYCLLIGHLVFRNVRFDLQGKTYDWAQYVVAGVVFPALLFGAPLLWRWRRWPSAPIIAARRLLTLGAVAAFALFVLWGFRAYGWERLALPVALALAQAVMMNRPSRGGGMVPARVVAVFVVALIAWIVAVPLYLEELTRPRVFLAGFAVAFALACAATWDRDDRTQPSRVRFWAPANLAAIAFIGLMSLRTEGLFEVLGDRGALHHWAPWVGSAELVRQGGWLLWDIPSMYGFLSILPLAALPTATPWQALYLLSALVFFLVGSALFLILRRLRPGPLNWCFALTMAIAIPMFSPTYDPAGPAGSTFVFPNFGAYRYVWCFLLVVVLLWELSTKERSRRQGWVLLTGNLCWLLGVLWSPESAVFCSGAWLPAYFVFVLRRTADRPARWRRAAAWLALPPLLLAAAAGVIAAVYAVGLGRLPDWGAYLDFVFGLGTEVLVEVNDPTGPVLGMLLGFLVLATGAVFGGMRGGLVARPFGLCLGLLGAFWATGSYGYARSYVMLHPVAYAALSVMLLLLAGRKRLGGRDAVVRAATVPLLTILLVSPLAAVVANPFAGEKAAVSLRTTVDDGFAVEPMLPSADPSLQALMAEAGVRPDDPISFAGHLIGNLLPPWTPGGEAGEGRVVTTRDWLPGHPFVALRYVPEGRGPVYVARFAERARLSGWLIRRTTGDGTNADFSSFVSGLEPWFYDVVGRTHVATRIYENTDWQMTWWEYVGDDPAVTRPPYRFSSFPPLPPDVVVDGTPLSETLHPEVWTLFGDGWGLLDPAIGGRWAGSGAELWVYSPESRRAILRFAPSYVRGGDGLTVVVNGEKSKARPLAAEQLIKAPVTLGSGWNRVVFDIGAAPSAAKRGRTEARQAGAVQEVGAGGTPTAGAIATPAGETKVTGVATPGGEATPAIVATPADGTGSVGVGTPATEAPAPTAASAVEEGGGMVLVRLEIDAK